MHKRREFRRLTQFYKIMNNLTPQYLREPVPDPRMHLFGPRSTNVLPPIPCKTDRFKSSFYPDSVEKWNDVGVEFRSIAKLSDFKSSYVQLIRPIKKDIFNVHNPDGIKRIFQLRVGLSPLKAHKKSHNFGDTESDICLCGGGAEDTVHFLLLCPFFSVLRTSLFGDISKILVNFLNLSKKDQVACLLYGYNGLSDSQNSQILNGTIDFILKSQRFNQERIV